MSFESKSSGVSLLPQIDSLIEKLGQLRQVASRWESEGLRIGPAVTDLDELVEEMDRQREHSTGRYTVMLLGVFNAGKSTFLNALLNLSPEQRLTAHHQPTTALPTRLTGRHPGGPPARFVLFSGEVIPCESWEAALAETSEQRKTRNDIREIILSVDHPLLRQIDLLDMPGTGTAFHQEHTKITRDYIANAEFVIFVFGADPPGGEELANYEFAISRQIPMVALFNAWGWLNPPPNAVRTPEQELIDQENLERAVREEYPQLFVHHAQGFRVYSKKCLEAMEASQPRESWNPAWGMRAFETWFWEAYLDRFEDTTKQRLANVRRQVARIAHNAVEDCEDWLQEWMDAQAREQGTDKWLAERERAASNLRSEVSLRVKGVAREKAESILDLVLQRAKQFVDQKVTLTNFELWKAVMPGRSGEELERKLHDEFRRDYLKLEPAPSWLDRELADYLEHANRVVAAEWRHFLTSLEHDPEFQGSSPELFGGTVQEITKAMGAAVQEIVVRLTGAGAVFGVLLAIPGGQVVDAVLIAGIALSALFKDPFEKQRRRAHSRLQTEVQMRRLGLAGELRDIVMKGSHDVFLARFRSELEAQRGELSGRQSMIREALSEIEALRAAFDEAREEPA